MGQASWYRALGLAAGLVLASAAAAQAATVGPLTQVSGLSPFAACPGGPTAGGTNYPNSEVEPSVAVNPVTTSNPATANIIGAFQQDRWSNGGAHGLVSGSSLDGGASWFESTAAFSACEGGTYERASDPWISVGPDGRAYWVSLSASADEVTSAVQASTSTDGGQTWSAPATIISETTPLHFNDKESVTADPHHPGTAYVVWDRSRFPSDSASINGLSHSAAFRGSPYFSKTTDGGLTWSAPRQIGPNQNIFTIGNQIAVEPDGTLVDVFHYGKGSGRDAPNASFTGVLLSSDGGAQWKGPIQISNNPVANDVDPDNGVPLRTGADIGGGIPDIAVDPGSGKLYVVWEDSRFSGGDHNDIALSTSSDDGRNWSTPVKVNQTPKPVEAFTPMVDVMSNGDVGVTYYDIRNNTPAPGLPTDYFIVTSTDRGATWTESRITPTSFDDTLAPNSRGYFLGDYQGLSNDGTSFRPYFVQTNSPLDPTDVWSTTVAP
jgi:hypothetical protein